MLFVREFAESLPVVVKVPIRFVNRVILKALSREVKIHEKKYYPGT